MFENLCAFIGLLMMLHAIGNQVGKWSGSPLAAVISAFGTLAIVGWFADYYYGGHIPQTVTSGCVVLGLTGAMLLLCFWR